jgi:hypothetical protein
MERATGIEPATSSLGISFRRSHRMSLPIRIHHFRPHGRSPLLTICHSFSRYLGSILGSRCRTPRHAGHQSAARARSVGPGALGFLNMGGPQGDSRSTRVRPPDDPEGLVRDPAEEPAISEVVKDRRRPAQSLAPHPGAWSVSWTSSRRRWRSPHWYSVDFQQYGTPAVQKHGTPGPGPSRDRVHCWAEPARRPRDGCTTRSEVDATPFSAEGGSSVIGQGLRAA